MSIRCTIQCVFNKCDKSQICCRLLASTFVACGGGGRLIFKLWSGGGLCGLQMCLTVWVICTSCCRNCNQRTRLYGVVSATTGLI